MWIQISGNADIRCGSEMKETLLLVQCYNGHIDANIDSVVGWISIQILMHINAVFGWISMWISMQILCEIPNKYVMYILRMIPVKIRMIINLILVKFWSICMLHYPYSMASIDPVATLFGEKLHTNISWSRSNFEAAQ